MYTMVLMMAMSGSGDAPNFGGRLFGGGCQSTSCAGTVVVAAPAGCSGTVPPLCCVSTPSTGCTGNSCHGGGFLGLRSRLSGLFFGCRGTSCTGVPVCPAPCPAPCPTTCATPCPAPCPTTCATPCSPSVTTHAPAMTTSAAPEKMPAAGEKKPDPKPMPTTKDEPKKEKN